MRRAERVVDVKIDMLGELFGELRIVLFLLGVEPEVFQQQNIARLQDGFGLLDFVADAIIHERDGPGQNLRQTFGAGTEALFRIAFAFGSAEMGTEDDAGAVLPQVFDRRDGGLDPFIVGNGAFVVERHVVIDPDQHRLSAKLFQIVDGKFAHVFSRLNGRTGTTESNETSG